MAQLQNDLLNAKKGSQLRKSLKAEMVKLDKTIEERHAASMVQSGILRSTVLIVFGLQLNQRRVKKKMSARYHKYTCLSRSVIQIHPAHGVGGAQLDP